MVIKNTLSDPESAGVWLAGTAGLIDDGDVRKFVVDIRGGDYTERLVCFFSLRSATANGVMNVNLPALFKHGANYADGVTTVYGSIVGFNFDTDALYITEFIDQLNEHVEYLIFISKDKSGPFVHKSAASGAVSENLKGILE